MHTNTEQVVFWATGILGILFALFISMFALDVFSEGYGFADTVLALFMHLMSTFPIISALVLPDVGS